MESTLLGKGARLLAAALLAAVTVPALAVSDRGEAPSQTEIRRVNLGEVVRGDRAVRALGTQLPAIARAYGTTATELAYRLRTDPDLQVDAGGRLVYACPEAADLAWLTAEEAPVAVGGVVASAAPAPLANTFTLHSRPTATRVIYLDFNGHTTTGTTWNASYVAGAAITTPSFSLDTAATAFSDLELERIQRIWLRVAEDYAAFDVDVTTEDPGLERLRKTSSTDLAHGIRVCIGGSSSDWYGSGAGGVAFVGSFNWSSDTPCFVFPAQLSAGSEKYVAEAVSHEVGHTLGLNHDGVLPASPYYSGHGTAPMTWAPIMGVGYSANITQWSKGEYANANNKQDDLALIAGYIPYRADDHGNTSATATYLPAGAQLSAAGVITSPTDIDVFGFTTGTGTAALTLVSGDADANLNLSAEIRNAQWVVVATAAPADSLGATFNLSLASGSYFLCVKGVGSLDPLTTGYSAYASLGSYKLTGTVANPLGGARPVAVATASIMTGPAPLAVTFSGTGSYDSDGTIARYDWTFSDSTAAVGATVSKVFNTAGTYTGKLAVTDNSGLVGTASATVIVTAGNQLPVARITSGTTTGYAPLAISFSGTQSSDPNGTITAYLWNFGDGTTSTLAAPSKTYSVPGNYTVSLRVTDNAGATATTTVPVTVQQNPATVVRVDSVVVSVASSRGQALVKVTNLNGMPVSGVTVRGSWNGAITGTASAVTDSTGVAKVTSSTLRKTGALTFTVTGLTRSGYSYDATKNLQGSGSVLAGSTVAGR